MTGKSQLRVGFLGGGMIAQIAHLPFYAADPRCRIVAIAEQRPSLHEALGAFVDRANIVTSTEALLSRADVDAVVIVAPRPATGPLTLAALQAGKHVLAEKPMAHTAEQARRLAAAAEARGLTLAVGYMKLYDPGVAAARRLVAEARGAGTLGKLLTARFYDFSKSYAHPVPPHTRPKESRAERFTTWPLTPDWLSAAWGDFYPWFVNAMIHDVNLAHHFMGPDLTVKHAVASPAGALTAAFEADGVPVSLQIAKTEAGRWLEGAEFLFEKGRIALEIPSPMDTSAVSRVTIDDLANGVIGKQAEVGTGWSFALQARGFVDALTGGEPARATGADGLRDMATTESLFRALG
jgi:predicted dehydrogenase